MVTDESKLIRSVYKPNDVATYSLDLVAGRHATQERMLRTNVATLDRVLKPAMPGEIVFVLAFTSHGKTSFMQFWARQLVAQLLTLQERTGDDSDIVVYISWETLVEELGIYDICGMTGLSASRVWYGDFTDADMGRMKQAGARRSTMPLWVLGYSLKRRREIASLSLPVVSQALKAVEEHDGKRPAAIFLDYLQKIDAMDMRDQRRMQVLANVDAIQQLARDCGCPVIVGCQAGRQILERSDKRPQIGDGQETSRIEQDADKVISLLYPCKIYQDGDPVPPLGQPCSDRLMYFTLLKQRHADSGFCVPLDFDPARNTFSSWPP